MSSIGTWYSRFTSTTFLSSSLAKTLLTLGAVIKIASTTTDSTFSLLCLLVQLEMSGFVKCEIHFYLTIAYLLHLLALMLSVIDFLISSWHDRGVKWEIELSYRIRFSGEI